jgi:hypothetical protein
MTFYVLKTIIGLAFTISEPMSLSDCLKQKYELQNYYAHHGDQVERNFECQKV